jgi:hypothetical protein
MSGRPADYKITERDGLLRRSPGQHTVHHAEGNKRIFVAERVESSMVSGYRGREILVVDFDSLTKGQEDASRSTILQKSLGDAVVVEDPRSRL